VYSLLDDLSHTARWRKLARATSGLRERINKTRRRRRGTPEEAAAESRSIHDEEHEHPRAALTGDCTQPLHWDRGASPPATRSLPH
jgi:acyl dehydratase